VYFGSSVIASAAGPGRRCVEAMASADVMQATWIKLAWIVWIPGLFP